MAQADGESVVGQMSFAVHNAAMAANQNAVIAARQGENILPFNARRRVSYVRLAPATRPRLSEGVVVVRFPLATAESRQRAPRVEEGVSKRPADSNNDETRVTPLDFVVTAFLILSVFAAPALAWTLLASLG
jgi:hypothetical protein